MKLVFSDTSFGLKAFRISRFNDCDNLVDIVISLSQLDLLCMDNLVSMSYKILHCKKSTFFAIPISDCTYSKLLEKDCICADTHTLVDDCELLEFI